MNSRSCSPPQLASAPGCWAPSRRVAPQCPTHWRTSYFTRGELWMKLSRVSLVGIKLGCGPSPRHRSYHSNYTLLDATNSLLWPCLPLTWPAKEEQHLRTRTSSMFPTGRSSQCLPGASSQTQKEAPGWALNWGQSSSSRGRSGSECCSLRTLQKGP